MGVGGSPDNSALALDLRRSDVLTSNIASCGEALPSAAEQMRKLSLRKETRRERRRRRRVQAAMEMEEGEEWPGLEPFFFDEAAAVADHKVQLEREQEKEEEERRWQRKQATLSKIREYDPKLG